MSWVSWLGHGEFISTVLYRSVSKHSGQRTEIVLGSQGCLGFYEDKIRFAVSNARYVVRRQRNLNSFPRIEGSVSRQLATDHSNVVTCTTGKQRSPVPAQQSPEAPREPSQCSVYSMAIACCVGSGRRCGTLRNEHSGPSTFTFKVHGNPCCTMRRGAALLDVIYEYDDSCASTRALQPLPHLPADWCCLNRPHS
ncbi:hypothetical protein J6590_037342 [Homalodisca vitripennis]|nr:hypothetical protein J6590_037342 [Homalodisca vitripennis]